MPSARTPSSPIRLAQSRLKEISRAPASNIAMPWRMLSSMACIIVARLAASASARASADTSVKERTQPPPGIRSVRTSSTVPSGRRRW